MVLLLRSNKMNPNLKPINNTFTTEAYGLSVVLMGPCDSVICGFELQMSDDAHSHIALSGQLFVFTNNETLYNSKTEWFSGFVMEINGQRIDQLAVVDFHQGISNGQEHIYKALYGEWGHAYTLSFQAFAKPKAQPMDIAKALVEDKLMGPNPGVGAIYTREVMERVLADFLNDGAIEVTTNKPVCGAPERKPWDK
ncbi:hypothetical protein [Vibrio phage vB_VnaS-AQKL99]|nr:hypothetical protein [Vibrio phage vB_VnaS-AQKL99]